MSESGVENQVQVLNCLKDTELEMDVVLVRKDFCISELISLTPGSILLFDTPTSNPATLCVHGKTLLAGTVVRVEEQYGLRVTEIFS